MKIVAITQEGREFAYRGNTAHKVSERSADYIVEVLNREKFKLIPYGEGAKWYAYDIDRYDGAYDYAEQQMFTVRKGIVTRRYSYDCMTWLA